MGEDTSAHTIAREGLAALWFHLMRCKRAAAAMVASPGQWRSQMKSTDKAGQSTMEKRRNVIAIIDDDSGMRDSLEDLLSVFGYRAEVYSSAEGFVEAAITTEASCLVIDIQLGDISGVDLARHLFATGFRFPIIFMTGSQEETHHRQALDVGCIAYLHKPFRAVELIDAITTATGCPLGQDGEGRQRGA